MTVSDQTEAKVIKELEKSGEADDLICLSTGVVLQGKQANPVALIKIMASFPRPKPPVMHNKLTGRDMENPDDPDYISRVNAWKTEHSDALITAMIILGTELKSKPSGMVGPDPEFKMVGKEKEKVRVMVKGSDFLEDYALLNLPMQPENKRWRYLTWVQTVACKTNDDIQKIQEVVGRLSGVSKNDVEAAETFSGSDEENRGN